MKLVKNFAKQDSKTGISNRVKALALVSGGLDSVLAVKLMLNQGVEVICVNFVSPFCLCDKGSGCKKKSVAFTEKLNIELKIFNISEPFLEMVKSPRFGYGKNLNPCIDCRILMLKKSKEFMNEIDASFIVTGEVLGQRPMSQNRRAMELIEKESGLEGLLVRPLSAKLLPLSIPEKEGWIKREELLDIEGRSRKRQLELTKGYNISDYSTPAGGCLLTDPGFSLRIKDLVNAKMLNIHSINLVKNGRYFRISDSFKLVVGRNHEENQKLMKLVREGDIILEPESRGPIAIGWGKESPTLRIVDQAGNDNKEIDIASKIVAYYCKPARPDPDVTSGDAGGDEKATVNVKISPVAYAPKLQRRSNDKVQSFSAEKISEQKLSSYRVQKI